MFTSLERYIPLFENYLVSGNKGDFVNSRNDPVERTLLELLTLPITSINTFREKMQKIDLNYQLQNQLADYKLFSYIQSAQELKEDSLFIDLKKKYSNGRYDYSRPSELRSEQHQEGHHKSSDSEVLLPNTLEKYLEEKKRTNPQLIRILNDHAFSKLSKQTLLGLSVADKEYVLDKFATIFHLQSKFLSQFLILFENQKRKTNDSYRLSNKILSCLTRQQLLTLGKSYSGHEAFTNEDYIQLWFNQLYAETIRKHVENCSLFTREQQNQKREAFKKIVSELEGRSHYTIIKRYINKFKSEILVLDTQVNDPSLDRLIDYLSTSQIGFQLNNIQRQFYDELCGKQQQLVVEPKMRYKLQVDKIAPNTLVEDYIEILFKNNQETEPIIQKLNRFIEDKYLRKISVRVRLYKGEQIENASNYFTQEELQSMKERRQIRLLPSNPKKFRVEDDVKLDISIKNVKKVHVKVYVLNLEKHLLGESCNYIIDDQIQLSFLIPTAEEYYENKASNPFEVSTVQLDLSKIIPKTMGVYIVDLQGETVTSRAVIRKGTIICVDTFTEAGQQFSFFDQNGKPLGAKDGLKVWIRGQVTQLIDNKTFVTYNDKAEYGSIVAIAGDYAETFQKKFQEQKYKFEVGYIYNSESFIVGRKAKVILHGRLSMNGKSMNLQLLKHTKITATVTNNQDIKTTFPFEIERWTNFEDQIIEFPIQAYTKQVNINVQSQITLQNKKDFSVSSTKDINIDLGENNINFVDFYLEQNEKNHYKLSLLGANGEPITNADVIITLNIAGVNEVEKKQVKTNSEGQINLGHLHIVSRLTAQINSSESNIQRSWQIDQTENNFNYNDTIHFKLGQPLSLPISNKWNKGDILFLRTFDKFYTEDLTDQLQVKHGKVSFPVINEQGFYILKLLPIDKTIEIVTLKNNKWEDDNSQNQKVYDEAEGTVYEVNKNIYQNVSIQDITFDQKEGHTDANITLNFDGLPEDRLKQVRVHVLANNYLNSDLRDSFKPQSFNIQGQLSQHYIQVKRSAYYSNKTFSEEGAYVWNRQSKKEQLIGNNLEKPSIFLKRILVRETTQKNEELYNQGRYIEECAIMDVDPNIRERFRAAAHSSSASNSARGNPLNLNSHNNFLLISGDLSQNLNGKSIKFEIPHGYSSIQVYVLTPKTALKNTYSLGSNKLHQKKDLRHTGLEQTKDNSGWTMSREINRLKVNDKRLVNRNSQWRTVGLADIFEFANNKKIKLYDWSNHLLNWNSYSEEKKREIYDKQECHELNTFLKFKDPKFFNGVVAEFIRNKIQKTIVDLCLLNDPIYITYTALNKLNSLNAFEKALLVYTLNTNGQKDAANSIVEAMELYEKSIKRNYEEYKNSFDTIINAKESQEKPKSQMLDSNRVRLQGVAMKKCKMMQRSAPRSEAQPQMQRMRMMDMRQMKMEEKKAFVSIESTKQYTERTYYNVKDYRSQAPKLVLPSRFWAEVARNFLNGSTQLISETFMYLRTPIDFILGSSFIPSESSSNYEISNAGENYEILPKSPMLLYVKEVKTVEYLKKFGVLINQRFFDPKNRKAYDEDGTEYDREVEEFVVKKCYICQTVVNNTSGTPLELQVLLDIPRGTIPLRSHEYTQIINIRIDPYSSKSYERYFYIPEEGEYEIYPSNASRGSTIIAKANTIPSIVAKKVWTVNKLQSFEDILRSGNKKEVIFFLEKKNIFDSNVFNPSEIFWMLPEKEFYYQVIEVLRKRNYYQPAIWNFGFLHLDLLTIKEFISQTSNQVTFAPISFEYFPYYSSRTHQFANESKSTIRNVQFKETYLRFLVGSIVGLKQESFELSYCYYLILQDRLRDANDIINRLTSEQFQAHSIQFDYMRCFLDLSLNAPNFSIARETLKKYANYPVESWKKLFNDVKNTIEAEDNDFIAEIDNQNVEAYQAQVIQEAGQFKVIQPAGTTIKIEVFEINLELYFSEYPFVEIKTFTSVKPSIVRQLEASKETKESMIRRADYPDLKDATVEVTEFKSGLPPKKVSSFWWTNSDIKVKVNENEGTLQVYLNKKRLPGAYVKVFSDKGFDKDFYRDGYTDMTGAFRYAMSDLDGIKEFSILVMTEKGGVIQKIKPPSKLSSY